MKKYFVLCIAMVMVTAIHAGDQTLEGLDLQNISEYDGLKRDLVGPMEISVPKTFFTQDLTELAVNGYNWTASFEVGSKESSQQNLVLQRYAFAGYQSPITVSVQLSDGSFRNFIAQFNEDGNLALALGDMIDQFRGTRTAFHQPSPLKVTLIASYDFDGSRYTGNRAMSELVVTSPPLFEGETLNQCCGPNMFGYNQCVVTAENDISAFAFYRMTRTQITGGNCDLPDRNCYESSLRMDYPNAGTPFHIAAQPTRCEYWHPYDSCRKKANSHYTENYTSTWCTGVQKHTWTGMVKMIDDGTTATIRATAGCQVGGTWEVRPIN